MSAHPSVLPPNPSLSLLANLAKGLRKAQSAGDPEAIRRFLTHHPKYVSSDSSSVSETRISLRDAQLVIAREHGFENWASLKQEVQARQAAGDGGEVVQQAIATITQTVPFFAVSDMDASLAHYVDGLGFRMTNKWVDEGKLRWCWLEHGTAALMLQEFRTSGQNARVFEGQRGGGTAFAYLPPENSGTSGGEWPHHGALKETTDPDGYTLLASESAWEQGGTDPLERVIPFLEIMNFEVSLPFYTDGLGFEERDRWTSGGGISRCRLQRDSAIVMLQSLSGEQRAASGQEDSRGQGVTIFHMCNDAVALYHEWEGRGLSPSEPQVGNGLWVTDVRDPDGYRLSFESPTEEPEEKKLSEM